MSIVFIEDKEFDLSDETNEDLLGTKPYAETLFEVVKKSNGNQNVGLFGGWGSGKSTIIKTLEKYIKHHNKKLKTEKIAFFKYDAWKYSNDDFRRSFIKSLNNQFNIIKEDNLNEILYQETTKQNNKKSTVSINIWHIMPLIIAAVFLVLIGTFILPKIENDYNKIFLASLPIIASFLFRFFKDFFRVALLLLL